MKWLSLAIAACGAPPATPPLPTTVLIAHPPVIDAAVLPIAHEEPSPSPPPTGPDAVLAAVQASVGIRRCFDRHANALTGERVVLHVEIAASGDVIDAKMSGVTADLAACIEGSVHRMHYAAQSDASSYDIPFSDQL